MRYYHQLASICKKAFLVNGNQSAAVMSANIKIVYLGLVGDIVEVEIKKDNQDLGWLYSGVALLLFERDGIIYEAWLEDFKLAAQEALKEKVAGNGEPGTLLKDNATGRIVGFVKSEDLLKVASQTPVKLEDIV